MTQPTPPPTWWDEDDVDTLTAEQSYPAPSPTLFCAMALFFLFLSLSIVMFVLFEVHICARPKKRFSQSSDDSTGSDMRRWFHLMLFVAVLGRSCSLLVLWIWKPINSAVVETRSSLWIQSVAITMPDMLFMSAYSFLIFFWARLLYIATESDATHLRFGFILAKIMAFLAFWGLVLTSIINSAPDAAEQFFRHCSVLLALCYALLLISLVHYGRKFTLELQRNAVGERYFVTEFTPVAMIVGITHRKTLSRASPVLTNSRGQRLSPSTPPFNNTRRHSHKSSHSHQPISYGATDFGDRENR